MRDIGELEERVTMRQTIRNRKEGNARERKVEKALDVIPFTLFPSQVSQDTSLCAKLVLHVNFGMNAREFYFSPTNIKHCARMG